MAAKSTNTIPVVLISIGVSTTVCFTLLSWEKLGWMQVGIYAGSLLTIASLYWLRPSAAGKDELGEEIETLEELRDQLRRQAHILESREEKLSRKLIAFQEWDEYPQPIDFTSPQHQSEASEMLVRDRKVLEYLEKESRRVYEKIATNGYAVDGKFQPLLLRDDAYQLVQSVARIYNPESENPILETSAEQLLRAVSRASLHLLVVLERLPLNVKEYDIAAIYRYIRTGIKAVDVYKAAQPWLNYAKNAGYVSRFVLGASPMSLAAWWLLSEVGSRGARKLVNHVVDYQAVALMHDVIRVLGYEVASIYGGDFRHRDPNWIYGAELTELLSRFPTSRDGLRQAMREIGSLMLRNEYDRIYLYRCVANHKSAKPERFTAEEWLDDHERKAIADQLEKFFTQHVHSKSAEAVAQWQQQVEQRLHVRLSVQAAPTVEVHGQLEGAIRSLASFLLSQKDKEIHELAPSLSSSQLFQQMEEHQRQTLIDAIAQDPSYVFDLPDLDPTGELANQYLADLAKLAANSPPYTPDDDHVVQQAAAFYRRDAKEARRLLKHAYRDTLYGRFAAPPSLSPPPIELAKKMLEVLAPDETALYLYSDVVVEMPGGARAPDWGEIWLLGSDRRLLLIAQKPRPEVIWKAEPDDIQTSQVSGYLIHDCRIFGGQWLTDQQPASMRVPGSMTSRFHNYFKPLLDTAPSREA